MRSEKVFPAQRKKKKIQKSKIESLSPEYQGRKKKKKKKKKKKLLSIILM